MDVDMKELPSALPSVPLELIEDDLMDLDEPATNGSSGEDIVSPDDDDLPNTDDTDKEGDDTKKWVVNPAPKPRKISERKRADNAAFEVWIEENQQNLSKRLDKFIVDNDDKSFQSLIKDFENKRIIASPRDYQLELFERAKTQNTIAVLDTGEALSWYSW
jgi:endoribonuclease Dicer